MPRLFEKIKRGVYAEPQDVSAACKDLIKVCMYPCCSAIALRRCARAFSCARPRARMLSAVSASVYGLECAAASRGLPGAIYRHAYYAQL